MIKGFGGIFWRTRHLDAIKKWYSDVLQVEIEDWNGTVKKPRTTLRCGFQFSVSLRAPYQSFGNSKWKKDN